MKPCFSAQRARSVSRAYYDKFGEKANANVPHRIAANTNRVMELMDELEAAIDAGEAVADWMPFVDASYSRSSHRSAAE